MTRMRELRDLPVNGRAATRRRADHELRHQSWARSGVASVCRMIRAGATGPLSLFGCRPLGPASAGDSAGTRDAESRAERSDRRSVPERYWHSDWPPSPRRVTKFTEAGCRGGDHDDPGRSDPAECRPVTSLAGPDEDEFRWSPALGRQGRPRGGSGPCKTATCQNAQHGGRSRRHRPACRPGKAIQQPYPAGWPAGA